MALLQGYSNHLGELDKGTHSLSPFLFTIVAEALSALLSKARECGHICGFDVGRDALAIIHLQFTDDTILFSFPNIEEIVALERVLKCFEMSLG